MRKRKVYSNSKYSCTWISNSEFVNDIKDADLVVLPGGADIHPKHYGEQVGKFTHPSDFRDSEEFDMTNRAFELGIPIIGICRGAQLLTAFAGGSLIQHVNGHHSSHRIVTDDSQTIHVNSIHHQMMFPFQMKKSDYQIIARAEHNLSNVYLNGNDEEINVGFYSRFCEPEIIYFPTIKGLGVQYHPEMMNVQEKASIYTNSLIDKFFKIL
jgi:gamma-glutamyl-gamma-aminobutyrate hydrolase PuuD